MFRSNILIIIVFFLVVMIALAFKAERPSTDQEAMITAPETTFITSGWMPWWKFEASLDSINEQITSFDEVMPFTYILGSQGQIIPQRFAADLRLKNIAENKGIKIIPTIYNDFDAERVSIIIQDPVRMDKHILDLVNLVRENEFDGINIDYEMLPARDRTSFTLFIQELTDIFHKNRWIVTVAIHHQTNDSTEHDGPAAQDLKKLGQIADRLQLMAYDYHWADSESGPIAPILWVEEVITYALKFVPAEKLILGVPLYGYDWDHRTGVPLSFNQIKSLLFETNSQSALNEELFENYFHYTNGSIQHDVWYHDSNTARARIELAKKYGLAGIAFWFVGGEDTAIYNYL